ncbi:hypothetical protein GW17_00015321 [Ensete ventricosum]|nr:hypothetical protein GW17_00015321 [Ensete ventricosum]
MHRGKRRSNLAAFFVESACGNAALSSVCAQGRDACDRRLSRGRVQRPSCAAKAEQVAVSHASDGSLRMPAAAYQRSAARRPPRRPHAGDRAGRSRTSGDGGIRRS